MRPSSAATPAKSPSYTSRVPTMSESFAKRQPLRAFFVAAKGNSEAKDASTVSHTTEDEKAALNRFSFAKPAFGSKRDNTKGSNTTVIAEALGAAGKSSMGAVPAPNDIPRPAARSPFGRSLPPDTPSLQAATAAKANDSPKPFMQAAYPNIWSAPGRLNAQASSGEGSTTAESKAGAEDQPVHALPSRIADAGAVYTPSSPDGASQPSIHPAYLHPKEFSLPSNVKGSLYTSFHPAATPGSPSASIQPPQRELAPATHADKQDRSGLREVPNRTSQPINGASSTVMNKASKSAAVDSSPSVETPIKRIREKNDTVATETSKRARLESTPASIMSAMQLLPTPELRKNSEAGTVEQTDGLDTVNAILHAHKKQYMALEMQNQILVSLRAAVLTAIC